MNAVPFTKYHGLGNDFILVDAIEHPALASLDWPALAPSWCDRRTGVGADGVLLLDRPGDIVRARIINADGSDGGVCGNGLRCAALHLVERHGSDPAAIRLLTGRGPADIHCQGRGESFLATVDLGEPVLDAPDIPVVADTPRVIDAEPVLPIAPGARMTCVSLGNPHAIFFVDRPDAIDLAAIGPLIERHPRFPRRANVHLARVVSPTRAEVRTWERGVGLTRACGTGAGAVAVAGVLTERLARRAEIDLPGGRLLVEWNDAVNRVHLTGPAARVYEGRRILGTDAAQA